MSTSTSPKATIVWSSFRLLLLALLLFFASAVFHLVNARHGHAIYRDQHLGSALQYYHTRINLLRPVIVGFNATGTPTPQELPLWQAAAGAMFKLLGPWFGWANFTSLLLFFTCLFPLYQIARQFTGPRAAAWTLVFFLAQPIIFIYAGEASTDGFSFAASIWFLYAGLRVVQRRTLFWFVFGCLTGALAALSKLPFFFTSAVACFLVLWIHHRHSFRAWGGLAGVGIFTMAVFFGWTHYTNGCIALAEFPFVDLRVSNSESAFWYFGDLHYRLVPGNWLKGGWRILNACFGSFALVSVFLYGLLYLPTRRFGVILLWSCLATTLIFTHLVLHHTHYYLMFTPAFALLCGITATEWEKHVTFTEPWQSRTWFLVFMLVLGLSLVQGITGMKVVLDFDPYPYDMAKTIQKYSEPTDKLLIANGGWGGNEFILSQRDGLSIWDTKFLEDPATLKRLKELGYNKLVLLSDSPLLTAVQKINPGQGRLERETYGKLLTPVAADWPTLFRSDDILIKQIP